MSHIRNNHFRPLMAVLALVFGLSGCVAIPFGKDYPRDSTRHDTGDFSPDFIVEHKTSRDEVLARLGAPDAKADDGSWVVYAYAGKRSETALISGGATGVGGVKVLGDTPYRVLTVQFDPAGVASKVTFVEKTCPNSVLQKESSARCVSLLTRKIRLPALLTDNLSPDEGAAEVYDFVEWFPDTGEQLLGKTSEFYNGVVAITEKSLTFIKMPIPGIFDGCYCRAGTKLSLPGPKISIPYSEIQSVKVWSFGSLKRVVITTRDGNNNSFHIFKGNQEDNREDNRVVRELADAAAGLLQRRLQAFRDKEQAH